MPNSFFHFKQFTIYQDRSAFKVGTDGVLLGACADISVAGKILDIGTGTGLIALMLAQRCRAEITALEPDINSASQASENVSISKWSDRIKIINTTFQEYHPGSVRFDLVVSNPPFFSNSLLNPDPLKAAARHDISLSAGELLAGVSGLLSRNGRFQVIMPYAEGIVLVAEAREHGLYCNKILKIRPLPTGEIKRLILTFSRTKSEIHESFLTIEHGKRHEFTDEYINLTKDFYLKI
ncbi:MAG TPA: methyltransferase [Bacteroidales bacterium]|nr:methyltransferase [Bacteroidales bacterium]HPI69412.1 methyltransferase [Bacteroidales bacterium]HPR13376.1 methyltransferase [Bacteroidales bacterium]HRW85147.1 methyltransferase [Bacteroidales bacterium]